MTSQGFVYRIAVQHPLSITYEEYRNALAVDSLLANDAHG